MVDRTLAFNSFNDAFYVISNGTGYYVLDTDRRVPGRGNFWGFCETIEAAEDAHDSGQNPVAKTMVGELLNGLNNVVSGTTDFASWNKFNDDVMWAVIALARGYEITGNSSFLDQAMWQFNSVWDRAWDSTLGGGLWWNTDNGSKNACINSPAAIAALILARNTTNTGYRQQADQLYNWTRANLYNAETGQVADHMDRDGSLTWWAFTYNQGTFAGAANLLYEATGNENYRNDAAKAINWARNNLTGSHIPDIINDEYNEGEGNGDGAGFKGILVRWASKYATTTGDNSIKDWLRKNAETAWNNRNSRNVIWGHWWKRTPDSDYLTSWECSTSLALTQVPF